MFASFHSKGTIPSCSNMLNTCASGLLICSTVSFSILGDNPSTPGDLFSFIFLILLATTSGVTINFPNLKHHVALPLIITAPRMRLFQRTSITTNVS